MSDNNLNADQNKALQRIINTWMTQSEGLPQSAQNTIFQHLLASINELKQGINICQETKQIYGFVNNELSSINTARLALFDNEAGQFDDATAEYHVLIEYYNNKIRNVRTLDDISLYGKSREYDLVN